MTSESPASRPRNAVVVGMPRSGTSMVAGIFARAGYFTSPDPDEDLRSGDHFNPNGYWEAEPLVQANARLFRAIGFEHDNSWMYAPIRSDAARALRDLPVPPENRALLERFEAQRPWLWKDPRLCYTLGHWWKALDADATRVLLIRRDPEAVYHSFIRVGWRTDSAASRQDVLRRIEDHLAAAEWAVRSFCIPHVAVDYADFTSDPAGVAARISDGFGLRLGSDDLAFSRKLDHSTPLGRVASRVDRVAGRLPSGPRRFAKRLVPRALLRVLFPERFVGD